MYTLFLIGNIASGKSTAARYLERLGARRIDLDSMAKDLYIPGSDLVALLAEEFGCDILDEFGCVRFPVLAERAFENPDCTERLNALVYPVLLEQLARVLCPVPCCSKLVPSFELTVVEVSAAAQFTEAFGLADEVVAVSAPLGVRRERAIARGMTPEDFDARASVQPSEWELCALASCVIDNEAGDAALFAALDTLLAELGLACAPQDNGPAPEDAERGEDEHE